MRTNFIKSLSCLLVLCLTVLNCFDKTKNETKKVVKKDTVKVEFQNLNNLKLQETFVKYINNYYSIRTARSPKIPNIIAEQYKRDFQRHFSLPKYPYVFQISFNVYQEIISKNKTSDIINFRFVENGGLLDILYLDEKGTAYFFSHGAKLDLVQNQTQYIDDFYAGIYDNMNDVIEHISNSVITRNTIKIAIPKKDFISCEPSDNTQAIFLSPGISMDEKVEDGSGMMIVNKNRYFITLILQKIKYLKKDENAGIPYETIYVNSSFDNFCLNPPTQNCN